MIKNWFPLIIYAGLIFLVSSFPGRSLTSLPAFPMADKLAHVVVYCVFGMLVARSVTRQWPDIPGLKLAIWIIAGTAFYGATDEFHQYFVPGRSCELTDGLSNVLGGIAAYGLWCLYFKRKTAKVTPTGTGEEN